ncbi:hypothetical protein [Pseudokordiimonas caeni]|uniref:hypothetical protein n=1 Tax=Pseudokordiimonas caeni TaxID=2997908 RepID=UPI0028126ED0|nr:hypothetical protein [Pseudokordiimonas caeni]
MATNLRTIHIGAGQATNVAAGTYATWDEFRTSLIAGDLPLDLRAGTGADEDWDILFYGDGVNPIYFGETTNLSLHVGMVGDENCTLTFRPAPGHGFADNLDVLSDPFTYGGSNGVTIQPLFGNRVFIASGASSSPNIVIRGLQFYNPDRENSRLVAGTTDSRLSVRGCVVWNLMCGEAVEYADGTIENSLLFAFENETDLGRTINGKSGSNIEHYIRNNIIVDARSSVVGSAIFSYHGDTGKTAAGNIFCGAWTSLLDTNRTWVTKANLISGTTDSSGQFKEEDGNRFNVDPRDIFQKFTPGSTNPADFDFRLKAGSPAIGAAVGYPLPLTDIYGRMRSSVSHIGPAEVVAQTDTESVDFSVLQGHCLSSAKHPEVVTDTITDQRAAASSRSAGKVPQTFAAANLISASGHMPVRALPVPVITAAIILPLKGQPDCRGYAPLLDISVVGNPSPSMARTRHARKHRAQLQPSHQARVARTHPPKRTLT